MKKIIASIFAVSLTTSAFGFELSSNGLPYVESNIPYSSISMSDVMELSGEAIWDSVTDVPVFSRHSVTRPYRFSSKTFGRVLASSVSEFSLGKTENDNGSVSYSHTLTMTIDQAEAESIYQYILGKTGTNRMTADGHEVFCSLDLIQRRPVEVYRALRCSVDVK